MDGVFSYLFDPSAPGVPSWYGGLFDPAFLSGLRRADPSRLSSSWLLRGDLLIVNLGRRISRVKFDGSSRSSTQRINPEIFATTAFDFLEWVAVPPSRLNMPALYSALFGMHFPHCITATSLALDIALSIDGALARHPFYLGMASVDLGNPIMVKLLIDYLVKDAGVRDGRVWLEADPNGELHSSFEGAEGFHAAGVGVEPFGGLLKKLGPLPVANLSDAGYRALVRHEQKSRLTLSERVLACLALNWDPKSKEPFSIEAFQADGIFEASVPPAKLTKYVLNASHPEGAGKARFFNDVLAIGENDWTYLRAQLHEGIASAELTKVTIKRWMGGYGVSFNAVLKVAGKNGREANVLTNWIMEPQQEPRLSTVYPEEESIGTRVDVSPFILTGNLVGGEKWSKLYHLAHEAGMVAHDAAVPTPMLLRDFGAYADGMCGHAWVNLPDRRTAFARWLLNAGHANRRYPKGVSISCPRLSQSIDRARAYARDFAKVLVYNGIDCSVKFRLD